MSDTEARAFIFSSFVPSLRGVFLSEEAGSDLSFWIFYLVGVSRPDRSNDAEIGAAISGADKLPDYSDLLRFI